MVSAHLRHAHALIKKKLSTTTDPFIVDATVGNGHDTLMVAQTIREQGEIVGYDLQEEAILATQRRLREHPFDNITLKHDSHAHLSESSIDLLIYNLGYLPGGDKNITTTLESTLISLEKGLQALSPNGMISVMCYPGHPEGARETQAIHTFFKELPSHMSWRHTVWNVEKKAPELFVVQPPS